MVVVYAVFSFEYIYRYATLQMIFFIINNVINYEVIISCK